MRAGRTASGPEKSAATASIAGRAAAFDLRKPAFLLVFRYGTALAPTAVGRAMRHLLEFGHAARFERRVVRARSSESTDRVEIAIERRQAGQEPVRRPRHRGLGELEREVRSGRRQFA